MEKRINKLKKKQEIKTKLSQQIMNNKQIWNDISKMW